MSGEEAPGQKRRSFPEILDLVFRLGDGGWRTLTTDVSNEVSQLQFAALCSHTVISAAKSAVQRYTQTLIGAAGMDTERAESESVSPSGPSTTTDPTGPSSSTSAERSSVDQSDRKYDTVEDFLREVMEKAICKITSSKASPLPGNRKTASSVLAKEMLNILEASEEDLFAGLESREDLQTKAPKAVEEQMRDLKERADHSSQTPESLMVQPVHSATSREMTANHVSQRDDLTISCTNDVSGGIKRLHHPTASRAVWNIPALNTGSAVLIRSSRRTVSPIFQLPFDSCTDKITMKVAELHKSELLLSSSSNVSLLISMFLHKRPAVGVTTVKPKGFLTEAGQAVSGATGHQEGIVFEEVDSAPQIVAVTQPQPHQRRHFISDETIHCCGHELTRSRFSCVRNRTGPLHIRMCSSEPSWVRNDLLRDLIQVPSVQVTEFMNLMYLDILSLTPGSSGGTDPSASLTVLDRNVQGTSSSVEAQERTSNMALTLTYRTSGETEDPLALLVNSEQAESERIDDVSVCDVTSPGASLTPSSEAGSETARDTLENRRTSSQETSSSSSSPLNDQEPEVVRKRSRGFHFFVGRKAPFISFGQKKSTKAGPAGVESRNHQSDSGNHLFCSALQRESTATPFKKARKRLSRMFSAVCKALPNPFTCMSPPS